MDVVPSRFPIAEAFDVLDADMRLGFVAKDLTQQTIFADDLGLLVDRIIQDLAVHISKNVMAHPTHDLQVAMGKRRSQNTFEKRLPGFAVVAHMAGLLGGRQFIDRGGSTSRAMA